jgi:AcrR family transcriptional regulator
MMVNQKDQGPTGKLTSAQRMRQATRKRHEQQKQELYHEILSASAELLLEQGYEHFSLRRVAERIGYAAGTIYLYFKDKDELLLKLAQDFYARFERQQAAAFKSESEPLARIAAGGRAYISFGLQNPIAYQLMFMRRDVFLAALSGDAGRPSGPSSVDLLQEEVSKGIDAGVIRRGDPRAIADALRAGVHGIVALALQFRNGNPQRAEMMADVATQILLDGLKPR